MAQQTPIKPPPQRPKIVRTPYGWDCKMEDDASVIPPWVEPESGGGRGRLLSWALVPLAIAVIAVVIFHPPVFQRPGGGTPAASASVAPPSPTPGATASPDATATPDASPTPAATDTPAPPPTTPPTAPPTVAPPAPVTAHVTGSFVAGAASAANTTCNDQGTRGAYQCQWGVKAPAGSSVQFTLTWPEGTPLRVTVWAPNNQKLYTGTGTGTLTTTIPGMPASTVVIVSPMNGGPAAATFDLAITQGS